MPEMVLLGISGKNEMTDTLSKWMTRIRRMTTQIRTWMETRKRKTNLVLVRMSRKKMQIIQPVIIVVALRVKRIKVELIMRKKCKKKILFD